MTYYSPFNYVDIDPRPKTRPCRCCARDVVSGQHCICVASKPYFVYNDLGIRRPFIITPQV